MPEDVELVEVINHTIESFNKRVTEDAELNKELEGITKRVVIELKDGGFYNFTLKDKHMDNVALGEIPEPDIRILSDRETIVGVLKKEIKVMKAWATRKVQVKGSFQDLMRFRKFF